MKQPFSIQDPVGAGETNRARDLETTRNALAERRLCRRSVTGQTSATYKPDLAAGIRIFQRQAGLEPDGLVTPGGPTALALDYGGPAGIGVGVEGKQADDATCEALRKQIALAAEQLESMADDVRSLETLRIKREGELDQIMSTLGQLADRLRLGIDPSPRNLDAVSRELNNRPNEREVQQAQGKVSEARRKISEIQTIENDLTFLIEQRDKSEQRLDQRIARFNRLCPAA